MSATRHEPYGAFNFLVDLGSGTGPATSPDAGFEECGPLAERIEVVEYRNGNELQAEPHNPAERPPGPLQRRPTPCQHHHDRDRGVDDRLRDACAEGCRGRVIALRPVAHQLNLATTLSRIPSLRAR
jgi:hypothetical protein